MLISQAASSSLVTGMPRDGERSADCCGPVAQAPAASSASTAARLSVDMFYAPVRADRPCDDRVVVIGVAGGILRQPFAARRLHLPLFVGGPALEQGLGAFPLPRQPEAHEALRPLLAGDPSDHGCPRPLDRDLHVADSPRAAT